MPGFTLLEVLLAMLLSTVVLAGLWSALSIHLRMFDAGRTQVEQAQLSRALLHQIANDLRQAIVDPEHLAADAPADSQVPSEPILTTAFQPDESSQAAIPQDALPESFWSTSETRHFRFRGGPEQLTFDVHTLRQSHVPQAILVPQPPRSISGMYTVQYQFEADALQRAEAAASGVELETESATTGLVRRVTSWARLEEDSELLAEVAVVDELDPAAPSISTTSIASTRPAATTWETSESEMPLDLVEDVAPEVSQLQFRYYDGLEWFDSWDSEARQGLPLAVEIALVFERDARDAVPATEGEASSLPTTAGQGPIDFDSLAELGVPVYRLVVQLPRGKRAEPATEPTPSAEPESELPASDLPTTTNPMPDPMPMPGGMP